MAFIASVSNLFPKPASIEIEPGQFAQAEPLDATKLAGANGVKLPAIQPGASTSFSDALSNFVGDVNTKMQTGAADQAKVLSGESTNLHQAMISMQEASVAFSMMVEVRNKMVESYQELMRMQV